MSMQDVQHNKSTLTPAAIPAEPLGALLRRAREAGHLELREAAARINVDVSILQALENEDFQRIGAPVFTRSYLKRYATLLGLPADTVLAQYQQLGADELPTLKVTRSIKPQAKMSDIRWISYPLVVVMVGWLGWLGLERLVTHFDSVQTADLPGSQDGNSDTPLALPPAPNALPLPAENTATASASPAPAPADRPAAPATIPSTTSITPVAEAATIEPPLPAEAPETVSLAAIAIETPLPTDEPPAENTATTVKPTDGQHELVLKFSEDCWVEVKDANNDRLAYGIIKANTVNTLAGKPPFHLTLGNAGAATITLNGEPVARDVYMPTRGSVSRFTLGPQG